MPGYVMVLFKGQLVFMPVTGSDGLLIPSQSIKVKFLSKQILISKRYDSFVFCKIKKKHLQLVYYRYINTVLYFYKNISCSCSLYTVKEAFEVSEAVS